MTWIKHLPIEDQTSAKYTRSRVPVKLLYFREMKNRSTAQKLESSFKKLSRIKKLEKLCEMVDEDLGWN